MYCNDKQYYNYVKNTCDLTLEEICPSGYYLNIVGNKDCPRQQSAPNYNPKKVEKADECFSLCKKNKFCGISYWDPKTKVCEQLTNNYKNNNCKNCEWSNFSIYGICNNKDIVSLDYIKPEIINSVNDFGVCDKIDCKNGACNGNNSCKCNKGYFGDDCGIKY